MSKKLSPTLVQEAILAEAKVIKEKKEKSTLSCKL